MIGFGKIEGKISSLGFGKVKMAFGYVTPQGRRVIPEKVDTTAWENGVRMEFAYASGLSETVYFNFIGKDELTYRRFIRNSSKKIKIREMFAVIDGLKFGGRKIDDYFYHVENPRVYELFAIPVDLDRIHGVKLKDSGFDIQAGNRWADPGVVNERIGRSPYQPFPAILLSNLKKSDGLVHGTLSQDVFFHNYLVEHNSDSSVKFTIFSGFKAIAFREIQTNESLADVAYIGRTAEADKFDCIFNKYTNVLRQFLPPLRGATNINRDNVLWGSWNDGIWRDVSEKMLVDEAKFLAKHYPTCRWMQLDDGYAVYTKSAHGLGVPFEGRDGIDTKKFPNGLKGLTDKIKQAGLRPAIWIGGFCPKETKIYKKHPEWFINYDYRVNDTAPLDVSKPEVREYMQYALDRLVVDAGFEGVKHDFWSYAFEDSSDLLANKTRSGYEWRSWWTAEIRKRISKTGHFQTGCDIVMGNPFLAENFSNYRYGIDIGSGNWVNVKTNFIWGVACFATHTGDLFVPNSDAVGLFPGLNDVDAMFCFNYCLVTHSMVEIAGRLSKNVKNPRQKILAKAICNPNNGQDVYTLGYDYRDFENPIPRILYFKTGHFTPNSGKGLPLLTLGIFNPEEKKEISVKITPKMLGIKNTNGCLITNVWENTTEKMSGRGCTFRLGPHGSMLLAVSSQTDPQILDANMRIKKDDDGTLRLDYPGEAELFVSEEVRSVVLDGEKIAFKCTKGSGNYRVSFTVEKPCVMELSYR